MSEWICGRNPVFEILVSGRRTVSRLVYAEGAQVKGRLKEILSLAKQKSVPAEITPKTYVDRLGSGNQGVALEVGPYPYVLEADLYSSLRAKTATQVVLLLDMLQDPQNLGTLLRTAEAIEVLGIFLPPRRAAQVTPAVVQASSGASEHLRIAQANLATAISRLKEIGFWVIGLENSPDALLPQEIQLDQRIALVVGNEGQGMRRLVRDSCDLLMRLPIQGRIGSLNASVAGSIALYLAWNAQGGGN